MRDLTVAYASRRRHSSVTAVRGVSFDVNAGEFVGLVGESGSGKSTVAYALLRLLSGGGAVGSGQVVFDGEDLLALGPEPLRRRRWRDISVVLQSSMNALNPVLTVRAQFRDTIRAHAAMSSAAIEERIGELLDLVKIDRRFAAAYPHELSGGMKQRVAIALALVLRPRLVVLDEPTTGLDVVVQHAILADLRALQRKHGFAVLIISHDLGTVLMVSDRVLVAYAGRVVEDHPAAGLLEHPHHPYTRALLDCYADPEAEHVRITYIPGLPPDMGRLAPGCAFAPRCPRADERCRREDPLPRDIGDSRVACHHAEDPPVEGETAPGAYRSGASCVEARPRDERPAPPVLTVAGAVKTYRRRHQSVTALAGVTLTLAQGRVTALVGESGSGKSTLARLITGMERPDAGGVHFGDLDVTRLRGRALREYRRHVQMVFQDPFSALNPANSVLYTLMRPLGNHLRLSPREARSQALALLETVGLVPAETFGAKRTSELSGGQAQRVVVARALAAEPEILVADEPVSMLDVSIRAGILKLLDDLRTDRDFTLLYITHDLLSARLLADDVVVLNHGEVVEQGPADEVIAHPRHPYTRLLLSSIPNPRRARAV